MTTPAQTVACACGRRFQAPAELAGRRVKCPACGQPIDVPPLADSLLSAGLAMQALPAANPLGRPLASAPRPGERQPMPKGLGIGLGVGGCVLVLILAVVIGLWTAGQRLLAHNMALAEQRRAAQAAAGGQPAAPEDGPQIYQTPAGRMTVEFPGRPRRELIRSSERGGLSHWEAELTLGEFLQGRGEQFLATEQPLAQRPTDEKIEAALTSLVNVTAHVDVGRGRILTTTDASQPGYRGREVTYEYTSKSGGRVSGRYRVLMTDRELISIEWVAAPAKAETAEVAKFFDSFQLKAE
jgi:hypothetical protein